jgi:hypothetical protein
MENRDGEIHVDTDEARGGSTSGVVRWVLAIGLLLAIIGMSLAWIIPALSRGGETQNVNYTREVTSEARSDGSSTDSIVGENADQIDAPAEAPDEGGIPTVDNNDNAEGSAPMAEDGAPGQ